MSVFAHWSSVDFSRILLSIKRLFYYTARRAVLLRMASDHVQTTIPRPPVITVMGHIDHGKSTLLDYIRKTNTVAKEAGGITQHLSAYEFEHKTKEGVMRTLTFLDTPGHEAFQHLRSRGSQAADVAILVVAADDGVMPQTKEALRAINEAHIPFVVAITKIDKPNANVERAKNSLLEAGVYLEGLGGDISYAPISSKTGEGVGALLDLVVLAADLEERTTDPGAPASGLVVESTLDKKRGISATLLIKDGTLRSGECVVAGSAWAPVRIFEDWKGEALHEARASSPVAVVGWSEVPSAGEPFKAVTNKRSAEECCAAYARTRQEEAPTRAPIPSGNTEADTPEGPWRLPILLKADVEGSLAALRHELKKCETPEAQFLFIGEGVGVVNESDAKLAGGTKHAVIIGFNVPVDAAAKESAERYDVEVATFDIIYRVAEWATEALQRKRPKEIYEEVIAAAQVLKVFSTSKGTILLGLRVEAGILHTKQSCRIIRAGEFIGTGKVRSLQEFKNAVHEVATGKDCGAQVESDVVLAAGDRIECIERRLQ